MGQLLSLDRLVLLISTAPSTSLAATATTTPTASTTTPATVPAVYTALTKGLHVAALFFVAPLATTWPAATAGVGPVFGFARNVVKERPRFVVGNRHILRLWNLGRRDLATVRSLTERRAGDGLLDEVVLVELGIGLGKVKVRVRDLHLGSLSLRTTATPTAPGCRRSATGGTDTHLVDLVGKVVHLVGTAVTELSHGHSYSSTGGTGGILDATRSC